MSRLCLLMFAALGTSGCQWLLGGSDDAVECARNADCPVELGCVSGRCVPGAFESDGPVEAGSSDMRIRDMAPLDRGPVVDAAPDATVVDAMPDAAILDAALPAEIDPVFVDGQCFDGPGTVESARGDTLIPRGICTPYGVVWTRATPDGAELALSRQTPVVDVFAAPIATDGSLSTADGRFVAWRGPGESGVFVLDLAAREPAATPIRPIAVSEVVRGVGRTAYVHAGGVFLHPDAEDFATFVDCSEPGRVQWGVALSGRQAAWFEQAEQGGPTQLVLADLGACSNRVIYPTSGTVSRSARVLRVGDRWVWLARSLDGINRVRALQPDDRDRLRPLVIPFESAPLELAGAGDWLVGVGYAEGAYRIDALNLSENRYRSLSDGASNHRRPYVWNGQLSWAAMIRQRWGVQYVTLDR